VTDPGPSQSAALVFIPGIGRSWGDRSLRDVADDLAIALDDVTKGPVFTATPGEQLQVGSGNSSRSVRHVTIQRTASAGGDVEAGLDLYELDYMQNLAATQENRSLVLRAALVLLTLISGGRQFLAFTPLRKGKTVRERLQLLLLLAILALYAAFLAILIFAIIALAAETLDAARAASQTGAAAPLPSPSPIPTSAASPVPSVTSPAAAPGPPIVSAFLGRVAQLAALVSTGLWLLLPPKAKIKEGITNSATDYLAAEWYLRAGTGAKRVAGDFAGVVEAIVDGGQHGRIDVVSYSLGSIVAMNELFPASEPLPSGHAVASVNTLVTVGCPFDVVRLLLPRYFKERRPLEGVPQKWLNVYAPDDILGSNFRNDGKVGPPEDQVLKASSSTATAVQMPAPENIPYLPGGVPAGGGPLAGFRVHGSYWGDGTGEETCWNVLVDRLYGGHALLASTAVNKPPVI
jgi:hypothetical protein